MFIDEITIHAKAGNGGDGVARWLHEKGKEFSGPAGGNGGRGGDVYVIAVKDLGRLANYRNIKEFVAEDGDEGGSKGKTGKDGKSIGIEFPVGSTITNLTTGKKIYLEREGERQVILEGGRGGLGNKHFKASTNIRPKQFTEGKKGEEADLLIELELFADAGLIGMPNAGKSSLLNALTKANAKVGSFQFTTLEPNLGDFHGFIIADIPGLIEGASIGKGLGHKFLRHIKKTNIILHCISSESENVFDAYNIVRKEIADYGSGLAEKEEIIVLTKTDLLDNAQIESKISELKKVGKKVLHVSIIDDKLLAIFSKQLSSLLHQNGNTGEGKFKYS